MKLKKLIPVGILLLVSVATLSAQNTLPNPHDDACWSSLSALRACELQAYEQAADYAQRCSSYPEYQCLPPETSLQKTSGKHSANTVSKKGDTTQNAVASPMTVPNASTQASGSK